MAAALGGLSALVAALGALPLVLSDADEGALVTMGFALVLLGSIGLAFGPLLLQLREGVLALRRDRSPAVPVSVVTIGFCGSATAVFATVFIGLKLARGDGASDAHWSDLPGAAAFFVPGSTRRSRPSWSSA